ncbi:endonuclease domain-containing protein [Micromonospora sp. NPDC004704]
MGQVFYGRDAVSQGLLTKNELRSGAWRQLLRNVYADSRMEISHRTRCRAAAYWLFPPGCLLAGRSAAVLYGGVSPAADTPVEVLVRPESRFGPMQEMRIHVASWDEREAHRIDGIAVTGIERTCWDVACWAETVEAVVVLDSLVAAGAVTVERLRDYALAHAGDRGWRKLSRAADLVDGGAESPQESRLRVRLVLAGLPAPITQYVIARAGQFIARVDLAWPDRKVAVEYDGLWHDDPSQFHRDRQRLNQLGRDGWIVIHVSAKRLREDFESIVTEIRTALAARRLDG